MFKVGKEVWTRFRRPRASLEEPRERMDLWWTIGCVMEVEGGTLGVDCVCGEGGVEEDAVEGDAWVDSAACDSQALMFAFLVAFL